MVKEIKASEHKIFPELIIATDGVDLAEGETNLFKIDNVNKKDQIIAPLGFAVESVASINVKARRDNLDISTEMPTDTLPGIGGALVSAHPAHEVTIGFDSFRLIANNGSLSVSNDFRSRLEYLIAEKTTARILANKVDLIDFGVFDDDPVTVAETIRKEVKNSLSNKDIEAIKTLWEIRKINVLKKIQLGVSVPQRFEDFLKIHETIDTRTESIKATPTTTFSDTKIIDLDVPDGQVAVLEGFMADVLAQAKVGELEVAITRDDDQRFLKFDPVQFKASQTHQQLHIHAFKKLILEITDTNANANYKAWAGVSFRKPGTAFKAKMMEFSPNALPNDLEPGESERRFIDDLALQAIARTGIEAIG